MEAASEHPIGRAVALGAEEAGDELTDVNRFNAIGGRGAPGRGRGRGGGGHTQAARRPRILCARCRSSDRMAEVESQGATAFLGGWDGEAKGMIAVADTPRQSAAGAIAALGELGLGTALITGDNQGRRKPWRLGSGYPGGGRGDAGREGRVHEPVAECQQGRRLCRRRDQRRSRPGRGRCGDRDRDGTDVAIETADVVLMAGDPALVVTAIRLARRTFAVIRQNLFWAFAYNVAAIPLAAAGLLDPMIAAAAMALSSVSVVTNSLRLRRFER